jgi:large subunit ribosomal protein L37Ae
MKLILRTKKLGLTGRFGTRYGTTLRKRILAIEVPQRQKHVCPQCHSESVKRFSTGIWECTKKSCQAKFSGGSYYPTTDPGITANRDAKRLNLSKR